MYRLLTILISFLFTAHAMRASVAIPYVFVKNYTVDDYKASCQNWGFSLTPDGMLYVANNSGLLAFDGNTWKLYSLPGQEEVTGVTNYNDTIYTRNETMLGSWTYDKDGILRYHPLDTVPPEIRFTPPPVEIPFTLPKEIQDAQPSAFATNGTLFFIGTLTQGLYITDSDGTILQHLSLQNQLQDNIVRFICVQDNRQIWVALDNGLSQISFDPPITLLGKRSEIGKLVNAGLDGEELYIQTNLGYFKRSLGATSPFIAVSKAEAQPCFRIEKDPAPTVKKLFRDTEAVGVFADAEHVYPAGDNLYWLSIENEAGLFHVADGIGTLKCRLLFDNYNMNLVTRGKRIIPLNDSLVLVSAMQGTLLVNIRELIGNSLGSTPLKVSGLEYVDASGIHHLPINTQRISLPHNFQEFNVWAGTTIFTSNHQISYKIEGVSSDWSAWQHDGKITFLQLPEGRYELKVRKYVIKGPYPELTLPIEVRPPWYNTVWAWLVYITLVWFLVQAVLRYNLKNLHKEEQEKAEAERQAEQQQMQVIKKPDARSRTAKQEQRTDTSDNSPRQTQPGHPKPVGRTGKTKRNARRTLSEQTLHPHEDADGRDFEQPSGLGTVRKLFQQHAPKFHGPPQTAIQRSHDRRSPHLLLAPHESLHKGNSIPHERIRTGNRAAPIPSKEAFGAGRRYESRRFPNEFLKIFSQIFTSYILLHIR